MSKATDDSTTTEDSGISGHKLTKSEVFELLSADRRQAVLLYLDSNDGKTKLGELAEHIASRECDCSPSELSSQQRKRAYVGLYQCHLPKMSDAGVIEYDSDRGTVALNENSSRLLEYLYFEEEETSKDNDGLLERLLG